MPNIPRLEDYAHNLESLRHARDWRLHAHHRAVQLILRHGLAHPMGNVWADMADKYEAEFVELDDLIDRLEARESRKGRAAA